MDFKMNDVSKLLRGTWRIRNVVVDTVLLLIDVIANQGPQQPGPDDDFTQRS